MKRVFILLLTLLVLCSGTAALAWTAEPLPESIAERFGADTDILDISGVFDYDSDDNCWFVLIRDGKGQNILYQYKMKNGQWKEQFHTAAAVPQTSHKLYLSIQYSGYEWPTEDFFDIPHLCIGQLDKEQEYCELCVTFELNRGNWLLHRVWSYTGYSSMLIKDGSISYYEYIESNRIAGTVRGTFQRDLRSFSLSALPKTLKEAQKKITSAPVLPASVQLTAQEIKFTGGRKYAVYTAPDSSSLRAGNGKAIVSTNGWIQVFGREEDWILIQYSIDSEHYRFGYIPADALPKKADVGLLVFDSLTAYTIQPVSVTDDPLFSQNALAVLPGNCPVTQLAAIGDWAYIEVDAGDRLRGFVPVSALTTDRVFDLSAQPDSLGPVYNGTLTIHADRSFDVWVTVDPSGSLGNAAVAAVHLYDLSGKCLCTVPVTVGEEMLSGYGQLTAADTALRFVAADVNGNILQPSVSVEW